MLPLAIDLSCPQQLTRGRTCWGAAASARARTKLGGDARGRCAGMELRPALGVVGAWGRAHGRSLGVELGAGAGAGQCSAERSSESAPKTVQRGVKLEAGTRRRSSRRHDLRHQAPGAAGSRVPIAFPAPHRLTIWQCRSGPIALSPLVFS
jgi:hypothetical protein